MNIHVAAIKRLFVGWLAISLVIGAVGYWVGLRQIGEQLIDLARVESARLAPIVMARINGNPQAIAELQKMTEAYEVQGFVTIDLYDRRGRRVVAKATPSASEVVASLDRRLQVPLIHNQQINAVHVSQARREIIRIVMPLFDGEQLAGHIEGTYVVPPEQLAALHRQTRELLVAALVVTLFTTILLYPFIISLDRKVQREARQILRGNLALMGVLGSAIAKRDSETNSHNYRVTLYAVGLAERVGMEGDAIRRLICGALLHDVGKIGIRDDVLLKPGKLNDEEYAVMREHVTLGLEIVARSEWLHQAAEVIGNHHEWFNGSGYPLGLAGEAIPLAARVFAIADVFDALVSARPYKERLSLAQALAALTEQSATHFDSGLLREFIEIAPALHAQFNDADDEALQQRLGDVLTHYWNGGATFALMRQRYGRWVRLRHWWRQLVNWPLIRS